MQVEVGYLPGNTNYLNNTRMYQRHPSVVMKLHIFICDQVCWIGNRPMFVFGRKYVRFNHTIPHKLNVVEINNLINYVTSNSIHADPFYLTNE